MWCWARRRRMKQQRKGGKFPSARWGARAMCDVFHLDWVVQSTKTCYFHENFYIFGNENDFGVNRLFIHIFTLPMQFVDFFFLLTFPLFWLDLFLKLMGKKKKPWNSCEFIERDPYHEGKCGNTSEREKTKVGGKIKGCRELNSSSSNNNRQQLSSSSRECFGAFALNANFVCEQRCEQTRRKIKIEEDFSPFWDGKIVRWIYK